MALLGVPASTSSSRATCACSAEPAALRRARCHACTGPATRRRRPAPPLVGRAQRPGRFAQGRPGEQDHVRLPVRQHLLGLGRLGDQADRPGRDGRPRAVPVRRRTAAPGGRDPPGSRGPGRCLRKRHRPGRRRARAAPLAQRRVLCSRSHPPSIQSVPEIRTRPGHAVRDGGAHRVDDLEQQPDAVVEAAAVGVVAPVGQRREELVEQVAVGRVDLDCVEPGGDAPGAPRRRTRSTTAASSGRASGVGSAYPSNATAEGRHGGPPARPTRDRAMLRPAHGRYVDALRPAWASWMPIGAPWPCTKSTIRRQRRCLLVVPDARVLRGDAALRGDRGGLGEHQPAPARGARAEVHEVPVVRTPSTAEYWHIGASQTRLRRVSERRVSGSNKRDMRREPRAGRDCSPGRMVG